MILHSVIGFIFVFFVWLRSGWAVAVIDLL